VGGDQREEEAGELRERAGHGQATRSIRPAGGDKKTSGTGRRSSVQRGGSTDVIARTALPA
jgi:hypothetical protein